MEAFVPDDDEPLGEPTEPVLRAMASGPAGETSAAPGVPRFSTARLFGSPSFFRLWLAQVTSSLGDWIGFVAITALAARVGGSGSPEAAVGLVLSARLVPGFFLAPVAGVLVDRWDRKRVMVVCDIGRGVALATLPWVDSVGALVVVSLVLEVLTLMWSPAKEASVPKMVPTAYLPTANSLSLAAAYGTFPIGSLLFAALAGVASFLGGFSMLSGLKVNQEILAIWVDCLTFLVSAALITTLALPREGPAGERIRLAGAARDVRDGLRFIGESRLVRAVMIAIATGLIGGGMLVPLGPVFARTTLGGGPASFGLLLTALGTGVAGGVIGLSVVQRRTPHEKVFVAAIFGAGVSIIGGASMADLRPALLFVAALGVCAGAVYILGFTLLQTSVADEFRGRIFATLYTLVRFCLLLAFALAPFLSTLLDRLSNRWLDGRVRIGSWSVAVSGARLTLWLGGLIILAAGVVALGAVRAEPVGPPPCDGDH